LVDQLTVYRNVAAAEIKHVESLKGPARAVTAKTQDDCFIER
jgi:hypothetical protein